MFATPIIIEHVNLSGPELSGNVCIQAWPHITPYVEYAIKAQEGLSKSRLLRLGKRESFRNYTAVSAKMKSFSNPTIHVLEERIHVRHLVYMGEKKRERFGDHNAYEQEEERVFVTIL